MSILKAGIKPIYHPYWNWECYKNGMYRKCKLEDEDDLVEKGILLLSSQSLFFTVCIEVLTKWVVSSEHHLSNKSMNRRAYLGHSACSFFYKVPEIQTRISWSKLNDTTREEANLTADKVINFYERENIKIHKTGGRQMLLQWDS